MIIIIIIINKYKNKKYKKTCFWCVQAFMERMGLWGDGAPFRSFVEFLETVQRKGLGQSPLHTPCTSTRIHWRASAVISSNCSVKMSRHIHKHASAVIQNAIERWAGIHKYASAVIQIAELKMSRHSQACVCCYSNCSRQMSRTSMHPLLFKLQNQRWAGNHKYASAVIQIAVESRADIHPHASAVIQIAVESRADIH